ncbi:hypothetical protein [Nocardia sp. NBC_01388]|uniref:hypothetical protein n=1 Tax=Nocardia sp. NBC_01388 TaxID=2903596 RepID=UPI00324BCDE9
MTPMPAIAQVTEYLRVHGWAVTGNWHDASVWTWQAFDVLVPPTDIMADASSRLHELLICVADAEGRSPEAVRHDMTVPAMDLLCYRPQADPGAVSLSTGARTVLAMRDLITASAREVLGESRPRRRTVSAPVHELLEHTLLAPSRESFGLDVSFPAEYGDSNSLGRRTVLRILHSANSLRTASSIGAVDLDDFARQGISEAECIALAALAGPDSSSFELFFHWSWLSPRTDETVKFPPGTRSRINRLRGRRADPAPLSGNGIVEGPVINLSDDPGGSRWRIRIRGVPEVDGTAVGKQRLIAVRLGNSENYEAALAAHLSGRRVRASGTFTGRTSEIIIAADGFTVTDASSDEFHGKKRGSTCPMIGLP